VSGPANDWRQLRLRAKIGGATSVNVNGKWLGRTALATGILFAAHGVGVADEALDQAVKKDNKWAMYGRTYDNQRLARSSRSTIRTPAS
jgi:hypothetical protein